MYWLTDNSALVGYCMGLARYQNAKIALWRKYRQGRSHIRICIYTHIHTQHTRHMDTYTQTHTHVYRETQTL